MRLAGPGCAILLLCGLSVLSAQGPSLRDRTGSSIDLQRLTTTVEVEILSSALASGVSAQRWTEALGKLDDVSVRVRQPVFDDELGVTETTRGTLRRVNLVCQLDAQGQLVFPDRSFTLSDIAPLQEWLRELKTYGAQGTPQGQPLWGLNADQFQTMFAALSQPITEESDGQPLRSALDRLNLPKAYPLRLSAEARQHVVELEPVPPVRQRLLGISNGTGLALLLADFGLGFRPLRTPDGSIELLVDPLADISDPWPVGWGLAEDITRGQAAPTLFTMVPVGFEDLPLEEVVRAISTAAQLPVVLDHYGAEQKGIDLGKTRVSFPQKRAAWMMVLNSLAIRSRLKQELRVDELGQPLIYIFPFVPKPVPRATE